MGDTNATQDSFNNEYTDTGNMCYMGDVETPFATGKSLQQLKAMVAGAKPDLVLDVADAWKAVHDHLVGGGGSVKGDFDKAVEHVLQHWEGESADEFSKRAKRISKQISDCAKYADYTSTAMRNAGTKLREIKPQVDAIEEPDTVDRGLDKIGDGFTRDDNEWRKDINGNKGAQSALDNNSGDLSAGKEAQLKAAAQMETLAVAYTSQTKTMGTWRKPPPPGGPGVDNGAEYPGDPGGVAPVPVPVTPDGGGPGAAVPGGRAGGTVPGGSGSPKATSPGVAQGGTATKVNGIQGGTATTVPKSGGPQGGGPGGGLTGNPSGGPVSGPAGGPGLVGQASGNRGAPGAGAKTGAGAGGRAPAGLGGGRMGGAGGAGGAAGKGITGAGGRGPLARARGGMLDTPGASQGAAKQGGQGLHSSRGGSQAGDRGRQGMMRGGMAGRNVQGSEEENRQGERPDYLVEDEETWMPKRRDVAPPTIG
ncbi:hypothetical protein [Streptomyces sp. HNM0574]|uniref:hypothetical protein n=1 Tax=Streptomyces sp. HNM0574 TaxID=2714954 RepID=UPI00146A7BA9|nr:hypothetical protein [Streptomyces sp. HNM0574]NLU69618.1 hypothetical protein [Streptomyces sp. HNM0574]